MLKEQLPYNVHMLPSKNEWFPWVESEYGSSPEFHVCSARERDRSPETPRGPLKPENKLIKWISVTMKRMLRVHLTTMQIIVHSHDKNLSRGRLHWCGQVVQSLAETFIVLQILHTANKCQRITFRATTGTGKPPVVLSGSGSVPLFWIVVWVRFLWLNHD